jgi:hypothetical protein
MKCNRCGKENPAEIHTCTAPLAIALAERLDVPPGAPLFVDAATELRRLHAENEALKRALKEAGLFLHHAWCDVQMNNYSFEKLNKTMEVVDAALTRAGEMK